MNGVTTDPSQQPAPPPAQRGPCPVAACGSVFDVVNDGIFVHDAETGAVLDVNRKVEELYEASREEICAGGVEAFSTGEPPYGGREAAAYLRAAAAGAPQLFEWRARSRSGRIFWVEVNLKRVARPGCDRLFAVVRDITARKEQEEALRESEQKLRLLANAMPQIVCVLAPDGEPEYVNAGWTALSGLDLAGTRRAGWEQVLHPDDRAAARDCRRRALERLEPQEVELRYRAADGTFRWHLSRLAPIVEGGRVVRFVGAAMEIEDRKRIERAREEQLALKDQLAKVAASVPGVVCSFRLRPDGTATMPFSGPGIAELYGISQADLARDMAPAFARVPPEDLARVQAEVAESARTLSPWRATFRYDHPVKGRRWIAGASIPAREEDGAVLWHGYVDDVTEQKQAEEALRASEEQFRSLADAMPQLVWTCRPDGATDYSNRYWCEYTGTSPADGNADGWTRALHPDDLERTVERWRRSVETGAPYETEYRLRSARDGRYRWFLARALPVRDGAGRIVRWFGTCTDIDEQKRVEDELLDAQLALAQGAERLREEHRRKDEFLGMLSHELRNPLAPIRNSVYVLRHSGGEVAERALLVIERQAEHLTRLVDDLLDVTRIARGKIQLRPARLDLRETARRTGEDFRSLLEERGVRLEIALPEAPAWVSADATRLTQVIGNLLHNASKFTRRGDVVTLAVEAGEGEAHVRVRDTGAGIDPALLPSVFDAFVQADRTLARTEGGLGLGLALVKGIVELHRGSVQVESEGTGKGAQFTIRLPLSTGSEDSTGARAPAGPPRALRRVLVVDDNRDAADSLAQLVALLGHEAEVAYDGHAALEKVRARRPDLILCDLGLPGMDGYEVARRIRSLTPERILLVAVSGYAQPEDVARSLDAGFDVHVAKPADPGRIVELLG